MTTCQVLLLGGMGSGKSVVAELLAGHGAEVAQADRIGHEVLRNPEVIREVSDRWPSAVFNDVVDRRVLGELVFSSTDELDKLESLTHPFIKKRIAELAAESHGRLFVVELSLIRDLTEGEWFVVVVDAPLSTRLERLLGRGISEEQALARIEKQPTRAEYLSQADCVVDNSGTFEDLAATVRALVGEVERRRGNRASFGSYPRVFPE